MELTKEVLRDFTAVLVDQEEVVYTHTVFAALEGSCIEGQRSCKRRARGVGSVSILATSAIDFYLPFYFDTTHL